MTLHLTLDQAANDLAAIVAEKGADFVYEKPFLSIGFSDSEPRCAYFNPADRAPSCIVGHLLARHGIDYDTVTRAEANQSGVGALTSRSLIEADRLTMAFLERVQMHQDQGAPWGAAVNEGLDLVEHLATTRAQS